MKFELVASKYWPGLSQRAQ